MCPQGNIKENNIPFSEAGKGEDDTMQRQHKVVSQLGLPEMCF